MIGEGTPVVGWTMFVLSILSAGVLIILLFRQSRRPTPEGLSPRGSWRASRVIHSVFVLGALTLILGLSADAWQLPLPGTQITYTAVALLCLGAILRYLDDYLRVISKGRVYFPEHNPLDFMCGK